MNSYYQTSPEHLHYTPTYKHSRYEFIIFIFSLHLCRCRACMTYWYRSCAIMRIFPTSQPEYHAAAHNHTCDARHRATDTTAWFRAGINPRRDRRLFLFACTHDSPTQRQRCHREGSQHAGSAGTTTSRSHTPRRRRQRRRVDRVLPFPIPSRSVPSLLHRTSPPHAGAAPVD